MPQVPTYGNPQVREQALQGGFQQNIDVSSSTRTLGQGLMQVAETADRFVMRDAETKANAADNEIAAGWLKWDAENRRKYQGANADQYGAAAEQWWANAAETYGKDFDPLAKSMVGKTLGRRKAASLGQVSQFVETEKEKHADETAAANVNTTIQFGVTSGDVVGAAARVRELAAQVGARKGWTTEQVQAEQAKSLSALHLAQITKLAEQDPAKAQAYYDANKAEVGFAQQPRVEEVLRKELDNQFATQFAAQQAGKPLSEQIKATAEIKDPARREKALVEVKNNYALVQQAQVEREKQLSDQAWQLVGQGKKVPESVLAAMDGKERVQLQEHLRVRAERSAAGKAVKTDMATYIKVREALMSEDPTVRASVNLLALTEKIAPAQMEQLLDIKSAGSKPGSAKFDSMVTDNQRLELGLQTAKIDPKKDPQAAGQFYNEVDRRVRAMSADMGGKPLTPEQKQKIVDEVAINRVFVPGFFTDSPKLLSQMTPEEQNKAFVVVGGEKVRLFTERVVDGKTVMVATVPSYARAEIEKSLRASGRPVTEQAIAEDYQAWLATQKKKPVVPAVAPRAQTGPAAVAVPGLRQPSIYAPPEEWAAYRAAQAQARLAAGKN